MRSLDISIALLAINPCHLDRLANFSNGTVFVTMNVSRHASRPNSEPFNEG